MSSSLKWSILPFDSSDPAWFSQLCSSAVATIGIASSYSKEREISIGTSLVCAGVLSLGSKKAISCPKFASFVMKTNLLVTCFFAHNFLDYKNARTFALTGLSLGVMVKPLQIYMSLPAPDEKKTKTQVAIPVANNASMLLEHVHESSVRSRLLRVDQENVYGERRAQGDAAENDNDEVVQFTLKEVIDDVDDDGEIVINLPSSHDETGYMEELE